MYQPAVATQKVDFVDEDIAMAAELDRDRVGMLLGGLRAQEREGVGEAVRQYLFPRLGRIETGAFGNGPIDVLGGGGARGGHGQCDELDAEEAHRDSLSRRG
ncbi:MAG TPA: hypothetical protein PKA55_08060 [Rhodoblastus sp.]|nr:hypothetical protein [Rhodoblastus sp.]